MKRTPADIAFSQCVRERSNWTCECCGAKHTENSRGLDCSHGHSRGKWAVRFDPMNAESLCTACHFREGGLSRIEKSLGKRLSGVLREKSESVDIGRLVRRTKGKGEIAKHYRGELKRMKLLRASGETGRIEFVGWV